MYTTFRDISDPINRKITLSVIITASTVMPKYVYFFKMTKLKVSALTFICSHIQWTPLNGITLGQTITDPFNRMIPITKHMSYKRMLLRGIWDLVNLSHFDPIIRMIPLTMIPLSVYLISICRFAHISRCSKIVRKNHFSRLWAPHPNPPKLRNETDIIYWYRLSYQIIV